jgi:hypothetical protein
MDRIDAVINEYLIQIQKNKLEILNIVRQIQIQETKLETQETKLYGAGSSRVKEIPN